MSIELGQIIAPAGVLIGALATATLARIPNRVSTKADRREDYRFVDEFLKNLDEETPALAVEKWYEGISRDDKAEAAEVRFMLTMRWPAKVFGLRRNGKKFLEFVSAGTSRPVGYHFKGIWKSSLFRGTYNLGNLVAYIALFALPSLPFILGKQDLFEKGASVIFTYGYFSCAALWMAITRIVALANMSCASQLVVMCREDPGRTQALALIPESRHEQAAAE